MSHRQDMAHAAKGTRKISKDTPIVDAMRDIMANGYARYRGQLVDHYTASAIVTVYDALSETNKAKYVSRDSVLTMANIAFTCLKK